MVAAEVRAACRWWAYRSNKARRELGWTTRSHEETVESTVAYWREQLGERVASGGRQPLQLRLAGGAVRRVADAVNRIAHD